MVQGADQHCIVGLLAKMAVDRTLNTNLAGLYYILEVLYFTRFVDAREAFINVCVDTIERWKLVQCVSQPGVLPCSTSLKLLPLLVLALLKTPAFNTRPGLRLDDRTAALINMKCLPLAALIQTVYPDLYRVDSLETANTKDDEDGTLLPQPDRLQLSAEKIAMNGNKVCVLYNILCNRVPGAYLMDCGERLLLFVGKVAQPFFCEKVCSGLKKRSGNFSAFICFSASGIWGEQAGGHLREPDRPAGARQRGQREAAVACPDSQH